jgi:Domain of unknown function (DUF4082)/Bacterial Ig-like domain/Bacterial Ig domain
MSKDSDGSSSLGDKARRTLRALRGRRLRVVAGLAVMLLAVSLIAGLTSASKASPISVAKSTSQLQTASKAAVGASGLSTESEQPAGPLTAAELADPNSCANPIVCENENPGTPQSVWDMNSSDGGTIQGFADPFSVNIGDSINFYVQSAASSYVIDIYRIGYYGGDGARLIATLSTPNISVSQNQPACDTNTATGLVDCGDWGISATWDVPTTVVSGLYIADLVRTDGVSDMNQIPFVVTDNASTSDVVMMTNDETWQAYNDWGGYSLYVGSATNTQDSPLDPGRAEQVSYNRPFDTRYDSMDPDGRTYLFSDEFPMIQFMEENGYDMTYVSQADIAGSNGASLLEQHKVFMTVGHSEYWDAGDRTNVTAARDAGVNLAFFSGNNLWWETRWANSSITNEPYRTLISYKESLDSAETDPDDPPDWTGNWRDPRFSPPADGGQPENALTGQLWLVNCCSYADTVPYAYSKLAIWQNTAVASLQPGQTYTMPPETLGYEWDGPEDNGFQPAGLVDLSQTCEDVSQLVIDIRSDVAPGEACNSMTLYKASSGALVFDAGTVQWAWGLSSDHDGDSQNPPDPVMQQATVNLLAMMGVQPATLMSGLVAGSQPDYTSPPTSTITSPAAGSTFANGSTVAVSGTATDSGGGVVAGVEVSTDGGSTWHPVTTMSPASTSVTWTYTWNVAGDGLVTVLSRASDDDGNIETPGPGVSVTVNCPCSIFPDDYTPSTTSADDTGSYELGMKFQSSVAGWVAGVKFYKGAGNDGTHTGSLWTSSGTLLATGTFTNETASGWQSMLFANPVAISANTTYVVSYYDPDGNYSVDNDLFDWPLSAPPLTAVKSDYIDAGQGNGVYYAGGADFPTSSYEGSSYAVDVIFDTTEPAGAPPSVSGVTPYSGSSSVPVSTDPTVTFSKAVVPSSVSLAVTDPGGNSVAGSVSFDSTDSVATFTPASSLAADTTYTVTVSGAQDSSGQTMSGSYTYTFITSQSYDTTGSCPCTVWPDVAPSGATDSEDANPNNLGVEFTPDEDGTITGVRFYKEPDDTGTHTGDLWTSTGTLLATGTFTDESTEGWEELDFSTPVPVTAGTTYVASYHTNSGDYAFTSEGLASAVTNGPLTVPVDGGVFAYGSSNAFPDNTYEDSNFWVDVVFQPSQTSSAPTVTATDPVNGQTSVPPDTGVSVTFDEPVQSGTIQFSLDGPGGTGVPGNVSYDSSTDTATFTPTSALSSDTEYTAAVSGAQASGSAAMGSYSWGFTTAQPTPPAGQCPCSIWPDSTLPSVTAADDPNPNNLGVEFTPDEDGTITGIRFYKGVGNDGTHVGSLWTASGTLLGQVTFTDESTAGWQQATFSTPISVTAGTTYVASYFTPDGYYAFTSEGLASAVTNGPLTVPVDGGVYSYGSSPAFPDNTYEDSNFWVDVVFQPSSS